VPSGSPPPQSWPRLAWRPPLRRCWPARPGQRLPKTSQQWLVGPGGELINAHSGDCLADPGNKTANGTALKLGACYGRAGETWAVT